MGSPSYRSRFDTAASAVNAPLPPLAPYQRCSRGKGPECRTNEKWDKIFARFEVKEADTWKTKGLFQSTLRGW
jgi:hypothetical protein